MQPCTVYTYILKGYTFVNTAMPFKNFQNDVIFFQLPGDPDPTYFFVPDTNLFTVNGKGFISLVSAGSLDFETDSQFTFTVILNSVI